MGALKPIGERLAARTKRAGACLIWTGAKRTGGYGVIGLPRGGTASVHRVAYELHVGPIPAGLHIDHLCRNRACVNPEHLEAVTQAENNRRAAAVRAREFCKRGHEKTADNTMNRGLCRACHVLSGRASRRGLTIAAYLGEVAA